MYKLASDTWDERELAAIDQVINTNQYTMGSHVDKFENQISKFLGVNHSIMTNSGSSANLVAAFSLRYSEQFNYDSARNVVLVPAVSWSTTFFPFHQAGFKLRFVDVDIDTLNLSLTNLHEALDDAVCGVCFVSLLGNPSGLEAVKKFCDDNKLWLMEDNCESFGASTPNLGLAGSIGDITTHSFFFSHHLQTMEGGMVSTRNTELAKIARSMRAHGWTRDKKSGDLSLLPDDHFQSSFEFILPGFCVRPIEFMGAIGSVQLEKWDQMLIARHKNAALFNEIIIPYEGKMIAQKTDDCRSSWFGFSIILDGKYRGRRQHFSKILKSHNIEYRPIVAGNFTKQPVIKLLNADKIACYENADHLHYDGLFVGNDSRDLTSELRVLEACLREFFNDE